MLISKVNLNTSFCGNPIEAREIIRSLINKKANIDLYGSQSESNIKITFPNKTVSILISDSGCEHKNFLELAKFFKTLIKK